MNRTRFTAHWHQWIWTGVNKALELTSDEKMLKASNPGIADKRSRADASARVGPLPSNLERLLDFK